MKKITLAALLLCITAAAQAAPRTIEVILPLTGGSAFLGKAEQQSLINLEAAVNAGTIKAPPTHFVFHDDQSSPQNAVQIATQIKASNPPVIVGSAIVGMCNAMAPLMKNGPVMYCLSPGIHPPAGGFVFTAGVDTKDLAIGMIRYWRLKGLKRFGLITSTDASGQDAERNIRAIFAEPENKDISIVGDARFNPTDVSVAAQIQRIKATEPEALIAWSTGAPIATVFKAISDAGWQIPVATTDGNATFAQMDQYAAFLPKELYIPSSIWVGTGKGEVLPPGPQEARDELRKAFKPTGNEPDSASTRSWDPALILMSVLQELGPDATAEQLRAKLVTLTGFNAVNGTYDFVKNPQRGLDESNVVVTRWDVATHFWQPVSLTHGYLPKP